MSRCRTSFTTAFTTAQTVTGASSTCGTVNPWCAADVSTGSVSGMNSREGGADRLRGVPIHDFEVLT